MTRLAVSFFTLTFMASGCGPESGRGGGSGADGGTHALPDADLAPPDLSSPTPPPSDPTPPFDPDAACASASEAATIEYLPVDIIWVVDNSASMQPAIDQVTGGLNAFAQLIAGKQLDYKIIMLSLRSKTSPLTVNGKTRYGVCIPPPLAGDSNCGNGPRFFQSSVDVKSTQPLEQLLGTLGQTVGYQPGAERGGEPWKQELRASASKTIVVVSDDDSRLSPADFDHFAGGPNPNNGSLSLPPGLLDAKWGGLFTGYTFDALYGWGSATNPALTCTYADGSKPPSSGPTYTSLVTGTSGARASICDGASAWSPFFDAVAQAVSRRSKLTCSLAIPTPPSGTLDPSQVNVTIEGQGSTPVYKVGSAAGCGSAGGWYYDDDANPTRVLLCPTSCDQAQKEVSGPAGGRIEIHFGCKTIIL